MKLMKPHAAIQARVIGYCNSCFLTARQVIEAATGKTWQAEVQDHVILTPFLGMTNTYTSAGSNMGSLKDAAQPYSALHLQADVNPAAL